MATKRDQLSRLRERMEADSHLPLREGATHLVFGEGNPDAALYFLGEAPGREEDVRGRPFIGQAGRLLTRLLEDNGIMREEVYLSNLVRFRPPHNRPPTPAEIAAFSPSVDEELSILQPRLIVTLGRFAIGRIFRGMAQTAQRFEVAVANAGGLEGRREKIAAKLGMRA